MIVLALSAGPVGLALALAFLHAVRAHGRHVDALVRAAEEARA